MISAFFIIAYFVAFTKVKLRQPAQEITQVGFATNQAPLSELEKCAALGLTPHSYQVNLDINECMSQYQQQDRSSENISLRHLRQTRICRVVHDRANHYMRNSYPNHITMPLSKAWSIPIPDSNMRIRLIEAGEFYSLQLLLQGEEQSPGDFPQKQDVQQIYETIGLPKTITLRQCSCPLNPVNGTPTKERVQDCEKNLSAVLN